MNCSSVIKMFNAKRELNKHWMSGDSLKND